MEVKSKIIDYIELDDVKYTNEDINGMTFEQVKMLMSFVDNFKALYQIAIWFDSGKQLTQGFFYVAE